MPMSVEGIVAMQACARIGATHSVVFGGFSSKSLNERMVDVGAIALITCDEQMRGGKALPLKSIADEALAAGGCEAVKSVIVYRRTGGKVAWNDGRDLWMHELTESEADTCEPEWVGRGASALHPVHVRFDRHAEGRAAQHRRLPAVGRADDEVDLRQEARRRILVYRRHRLDHRTQLYRLWPDRDRRDAGRVRRRADVSERRPLLGHDRAPQGHDLLHGADRDPLAHQGIGSRSEGASEELRPVDACA